MAKKIINCTRCKGAGYGNWRVDMGRCFKCNGKGRMEVVDVATLHAELIKQYEADLERIAGLAAECNTAHDKRIAAKKERFARSIKSPCPKKLAKSIEWTNEMREEVLAGHRVHYKESSRILKRLKACKPKSTKCLEACTGRKHALTRPRVF